MSAAEDLADKSLDAVMPGLRKKLDGMWHAKAITVLGVTDQSHAAASLVGHLFRDDATFDGPVHLVNPKRTEIFGHPVVPSVDAIDGELGLMISLLNAPNSLKALNSLERLPDVACLYTEGFGFHEGDALPQTLLADWALAHQVPVLGPGCAAIGSRATKLFGMMGPHPEDVVWGPVGLVGQSGGLMSSAIREFMMRGYGISRAIAYGKGAFLGATEMIIDQLVADDVEVVGCYAEAAPDVDGLRRVGQLSQIVGKPVVLIVPGTSEAGQLAAASHTGALATSRRVLEGVARQYGIVLVNDMTEFMMSMEAFLITGQKKLSASGVGIFATSGGAGILATDALSKAGIALPEPQPEIREVLLVEEERATYNPFDAGAVSLDDNERYGRLVTTFASDPNFGAVIFISGVGLPLPEYKGHAAHCQIFVDSLAKTNALAILAEPIQREQRDILKFKGSLPASGTAELAAKLRALIDWTEGSEGIAAEAPSGATSGATRVVGGVEVETFLSSVPVAWPATKIINDASADTIAGFDGWYPVVAKTESGLAHRAKMGGVLLNIAKPEELKLAVELLTLRFPGDVSVSKYVDHVGEFFLGIERTEEHGLLLAFGSGGSDLGEVLEMRSIPLDEKQIDAMIRRVLHPSDELLKTIREVVRAATVLALADNRIASVDLNPIVFDDAGTVTVLDGKVHLHG